MGTVTLRGIHKSYGKQEVIRGIDIELAEECLDVSRREHAGRGPEDEVRPCSGPPTQHQ